jgi:hypothetical protein
MLLVSSDWILSAFHRLNPTGYGIFLVLAAVVFFSGRLAVKERRKSNPAQWTRRFNAGS